MYKIKGSTTASNHIDIITAIDDLKASISVAQKPEEEKKDV